MAEIVVLAGTNGGGKSTIAGEFLRAAGLEYFDPDEYARAIRSADRGMSQVDANAMAWASGRDALEYAIATRTSFSFETTLGGRTITGLLMKAANVGLPVRVWYVGLESVEAHLERIASRVAEGGHDIPAATVRERYDASRRNLIDLLPHLTELKVYDNSRTVDLDRTAPEPQRILHIRAGNIAGGCALDDVPTWAKPIVLSALDLFGGK